MQNRAEYRKISPDEAVGRVDLLQTIFRKIEQDNCFIIQQIVNETHFAPRKSVIRKKIVRFRTKLDDLRALTGYLLCTDDRYRAR